MAIRAILATRKLIPISLASGAFTELTAFDGAWPFMGVDYGNIGNDSNPPTLAYVNEVDNTDGGKIGVLLPLSAEGQVVNFDGVVFPQFRRPIAYQCEKRESRG